MRDSFDKFSSLDLQATEHQIKKMYKETRNHNCLYDLAVIHIIKNNSLMAKAYANKGKQSDADTNDFDELLRWISDLVRYQCTTISCDNPSSLSKEFMEMLIMKPTMTIHVGGYGSNRYPTIRYLTAINVLTCITVMAWSPEQKGFVSHIPIATLLQGCRKNAPLKNLTKQLKKTFNSNNVVVHLIGGHQHTDQDIALQTYYPLEKEKQSFSWHVQNAILKSGLNDIRTNLLNSFPGADIRTLEDEIRLRKQNQRLNIVALDLMNGSIMVHSKESEEHFVMNYVPQKVINAELRAYRQLSENLLGNPLTLDNTKW